MFEIKQWKPNLNRGENRHVWARRRTISKAPTNSRPPRVSLNLRTPALKRPYLILPTLTPFAFWILWLSELYLASLTVTLAKLTVALSDDVDLFHWSVDLLRWVETNIAIVYVFHYIYLFVFYYFGKRTSMKIILTIKNYFLRLEILMLSNWCDEDVGVF